MPQNYQRSDRIAEEIRRIVSQAIPQLKDPRLPTFVSVVRVDVTRDMSYARIYVSTIGDDGVQQDMMKALQSASGYIKHQMNHALGTKVTPEPQFILDDSIEHGVHLSKIMREIMPQTPETHDDE